MNELGNCARCGAVFAKNIRDVCQKCHREEEDAFKTVYRFLTKRKNREATINEIVEATEVEEELIIKFIKEKRLRASQFPKLAYPCEKCGADINEGKLCGSCSDRIKSELKQFDDMQQREKERKEREHQSVYFTMNKDEK